jgi:hypothetical protein
MPPSPLLLALYEALILEYQGGPRADADHRTLYDLVAKAECTLPPDHPALEALRHYQDEALQAIEDRDHCRLARPDGPRVFVPKRDMDPSHQANLREALRRALALENNNPTN